MVIVLLRLCVMLQPRLTNLYDIAFIFVIFVINHGVVSRQSCSRVVGRWRFKYPACQTQHLVAPMSPPL